LFACQWGEFDSKPLNQSNPHAFASSFMLFFTKESENFPSPEYHYSQDN
jgi:hypothetical protein